MYEFQNLLTYVNQTEDDVFEGKRNDLNRIAFYHCFLDITIQTILEQTQNEGKITNQQTQQNIAYATQVTTNQAVEERYCWLPNSLKTTKEEARAVLKAIMEDRYKNLSTQIKETKTIYENQKLLVLYVMDLHNIEAAGLSYQALPTEILEQWIESTKQQSDTSPFLSQFLTNYQEHNYVFHEPNLIDSASKMLVVDCLKRENQVPQNDQLSNVEPIWQASISRCPTMKPMLKALQTGKRLPSQVKVPQKVK